ncbi:hypothetical protein [Brevundimonas naejangsanensis]
MTYPAATATVDVDAVKAATSLERFGGYFAGEEGDRGCAVAL